MITNPDAINDVASYVPRIGLIVAHSLRYANYWYSTLAPPGSVS
jgi:hypothetical protein